MQKRGVSSGKFAMEQRGTHETEHCSSMIGRNHLLEKGRRTQLNICLWKPNLNLLQLIAWVEAGTGVAQVLCCAQCQGWASQVGREIAVILSLGTAGRWALKMGLPVQTSVPKRTKSLLIDPIFVQIAACVLCATRIYCTQNVGVLPNIVLSCQKLWPSSGRMEINKQVTGENY